MFFSLIAITFFKLLFFANFLIDEVIQMFVYLLDLSRIFSEQNQHNQHTNLWYHLNQPKIHYHI
jgi:hypothetical protein